MTTPTGNALTDANAGAAGAAAGAQVQMDPQAAADAINAANTAAANVASDCLWPPSGQFSVPIIPGVFHQSVSIPCLLTYSEARAVVGALIGTAGLIIMFGGVQILAVGAGVSIALRVLGGGKGKGAAKGSAAEGAAAPASSEVALAA